MGWKGYSHKIKSGTQKKRVLKSKTELLNIETAPFLCKNDLYFLPDARWDGIIRIAADRCPVAERVWTEGSKY